MFNRIASLRWKTWGLVFVFWTMLALSYTASMVISSISEGSPVAWSRPFTWNLTNFYLWMLLTPLVAWLGRRGGGHGWARFWAVHVPCSVAIAAIQVMILMSIYWLLCGPPASRSDMSFVAFARMQSVYNVHLGWITYWVLLVVLRGMESQRRLRDERLRSSQLETRLVQSQLQTLRVQLQPHFLFNTLNAISALALADPVQARLMIARLSDFLRLTLEERHAQQVPLSRELEFLECYLGIQQVRFQDRLTTHLDIAGNTVHALVPNMILQPLVENALHHGLLDKPERGTLHIVTRRDGDELHLQVDDDGLGLPPGGPKDGLGLGNTRTRLEILFGTAATLELWNKPEGGTRVELRFPFREQAT
ncbi:histidine kinase [Luteibacter rhizovicinus]|uniref:Histidine kinase n=1 Tax=Luteibacter rhizovicinus TaxID=242606 RepID=A0A4R3YP74_9GAMM|nr:histidine kinase [Luteibacter rhizovicinus]TCV94685.1 histidine kinase [Luteibacter rhizovicinus]